MAMGTRRRHAKQASMWVAIQDLPRTAGHPFYARLNQILDQHDFDAYVEGVCQQFYADDGRPGLPPGRYFRLLLIGYFEGWTPSVPLRGLRLLRLRGERLERPFAHLYETGGMRRCTSAGTRTFGSAY